MHAKADISKAEHAKRKVTMVIQNYVNFQSEICTVWVHHFHPGPCWVGGIIKNTIGNVMFNVNIEGKDMSWRHPVNQLRTRLTSLPFMINNSDSKHSDDPLAYSCMPGTTHTLCRSFDDLYQPYTIGRRNNHMYLSVILTQLLLNCTKLYKCDCLPII